MIDWVIGLFNVLERTRLKLYECHEITTETVFKGKEYLIRLTDDFFEIYSVKLVKQYQFQRYDKENDINKGVLKGLENDIRK